jgi:SAM-dependent methyltransferase
MKFRESGMPDETMWKTFFHPEEILERMAVNSEIDILMDIGCGYGTFLFPAADIVQRKVIGVDIDEKMIETCRYYIEKVKHANVELVLADVSSLRGFELLKHYQGEIDYICLFNILHCEAPIELLEKAYQLLKIGGRIGVIHWKYEDTPRGPSMEIRPTPEKIITWAQEVGLQLEKRVEIQPYHYGLVFIK